MAISAPVLPAEIITSACSSRTLSSAFHMPETRRPCRRAWLGLSVIEIDDSQATNSDTVIRSPIPFSIGIDDVFFAMQNEPQIAIPAACDIGSGEHNRRAVVAAHHVERNGDGLRIFRCHRPVEPPFGHRETAFAAFGATLRGRNGKINRVSKLPKQQTVMPFGHSLRQSSASNSAPSARANGSRPSAKCSSHTSARSRIVPSNSSGISAALRVENQLPGIVEARFGQWRSGWHIGCVDRCGNCHFQRLSTSPHRVERPPHPPALRYETLSLSNGRFLLGRQRTARHRDRSFRSDSSPDLGRRIVTFPRTFLGKGLHIERVGKRLDQSHPYSLGKFAPFPTDRRRYPSRPVPHFAVHIARKSVFRLGVVRVDITGQYF